MTNARRARLALQRRSDESFLAHPRQNHVTPRDRAVEIRPRRERRWRPRQAGDERTLREVELFGGPTEEMPRHRLDAVHAGAEVNPVEIKLEHLILRQLPVNHHRQHRFARLSTVGLLVRQEKRARQLLGERASTFDGSGRAQIADNGTAECDGIDARMRVEPVILDRDERVLQVLGNLAERYVPPVLVHAEPAPAVGREKPRIADPARQPVNGITLTQQPRHRERREDDHADKNHGRNAVPPAARLARPTLPRRPPARAPGHSWAGVARRRCSTKDSTM